LVDLLDGPVGADLGAALAALAATETLAFWAATLLERLRTPPAGDAVAGLPPRRGAPRGREAMISSREWSRLADILVVVGEFAES
jgi:hypothetical protein